MEFEKEGVAAKLEAAVRAESDARRMCFAQGKDYVHMLFPGNEFVITEEPDGTVRNRHIQEGTITRELPDGRVDDFRAGDPQDMEPSYLVRRVR